MSYEIEQDFDALLKIIGAGKKICGSVKGGEGICVCAGFCIAFECGAFLAFKKLVLKIMGNSLRKLSEFAVFGGFYAGINGAVGCSEHRIGGVEAFHRRHENGKSAGVLNLIVAIAEALAFDFCHFAAHSVSPPLRKKTAASFAFFAAAMTSSLVIFSMASLSSFGVITLSSRTPVIYQLSTE